MSAEVLRRAAALMRERAAAATPGPWSYADEAVWAAPGYGQICGMGLAGNGVHVASWHPAVALKVADWLEGEAIVLESTEDFTESFGVEIKHSSGNSAHIRIGKSKDGNRLRVETNEFAEAVARAYLGEES